MSEKTLYLLATFDEETSKRVNEIQHIISEASIADMQTPNLPRHITLTCFDTSRENEIKKLLQDVCAKTKSFGLTFNHIGLFGLNVMFLAPNVNYELLDLYRSFDKDSIRDGRGWTAHMTILLGDDENIQKALPLIAKNFQQLNARVVSVSLYEFFPTRFITGCNLL